ncbi:hypothetical protein [Flavobacterium sp.]|jgi:hypothetical protein|uniref:hypothetical protein n=1 Tax=Flavobacterium sp. TaxID=239 RepID=UPI0037C0544D
MNRPYIAFYKGKQTQVEATSSYEAQQKAAAFFKAKKSYEVTVMLADVTHSTQHI